MTKCPTCNEERGLWDEQHRHQNFVNTHQADEIEKLREKLAAAMLVIDASEHVKDIFYTTSFFKTDLHEDAVVKITSHQATNFFDSIHRMNRALKDFRARDK